MTVKAELVPLNKAGSIIEKAFRLRDPERYETARASAKQDLADKKKLWRKRVKAELARYRVENNLAATAKLKHTGPPPTMDGWFTSRGWVFGARDAIDNPLSRCGLVDINREYSAARMDTYAEEMAAGRWYFSPDPIVFTEDGYCLNGQHRLLAAQWHCVKHHYLENTDPLWQDGDDVPLFLIVWGVDKRAALLMDEARRSREDFRHIALGYAKVVSD